LKNEKIKVKNSLRFVSWLGYSEYTAVSSISYILFKLEEFKKSEVLSLCQYTCWLLRHKCHSHSFSLWLKTIDT